jgi:hypothetical protein
MQTPLTHSGLSTQPRATGLFSRPDSFFFFLGSKLSALFLLIHQHFFLFPQKKKKLFLEFIIASSPKAPRLQGTKKEAPPAAIYYLILYGLAGPNHLIKTSRSVPKTEITSADLDASLISKQIIDSRLCSYYHLVERHAVKQPCWLHFVIALAENPSDLSRSSYV